MVRTFRQEGNNVVTFEEGKRVSTGTFESAQTKGFTGKLEDGSDFQQPQESTQVTAPKIDISKTTDISTPINAPIITDAPTLPEPKANAIQASFITSVSETATKARGAVEEKFNQQKADIEKKIEDSQKKIDALTEKEELLIEGDLKSELEPFREDLEKSERERLHVTENFEANQKLTNELEQLLTEGNELISGERNRFASRASISKGVNKAMENVTARAGVIQAVISARNGQINQAFTMIDRTVGAMNADRQDQLTYFNTILDFYDDQKGDEEDKIATLDSDQKKIIEKEVKILEKDMERAEEYAENIKKAMIDPDTALLYAQAGVTLSDSPEEVAKKISKATFQKEVQDSSNEMAVKGFTFLPKGGKAPEGTETVVITDSKGGKKSYYKKKSVSDVDKLDRPMSLADIKNFQDIHGWTPAIGVSQNEALQVMQDNPGATPAELQLAVDEAVGIEQVPPVTVDEVTTFINENITDVQMKAIKESAKEKGFTKGGFLGFGVGEKGVEEFLASSGFRTRIQLSIEQGFTKQEILDFLTS